ncbi:DNA polymerase Y family protein [Phycisphaerales bacterium AB-hyl4]|uniref:DNA polymerase Y family protein n=1 Tax=Natronomicrosphaera hydrolytica TaxID=3242702 RepID=A0ABV4U3B3_9BACT
MLLTRAERGREVVVQACRRSQRCGVTVGMSVAHARALLPVEVVVQPHQPARDAAMLAALARWAQRFTPVSQADPPNGLLLEINGCEHLFGGTRAMLRQVVTQMSRLGVQGHGATGPTVGCAWALARFGRAGAIVESPAEVAKALATLPVRALRVEPAVVKALHAVAVETVGQVMALPRASLGERFGSALLLRLDQALGEAFEPVEPSRPHEPVQVTRDIAGPVKQLEAILQCGRELVEALCEQLAQREAGVRHLRLHLARIDAQDLYEELTLSRASREVRHLWSLLRPRLERVHLGFGIESMTLYAVATVRLPHQQSASAHGQGNVDEGAATQAIGELVDQLTSRFSAERVSMVQPTATHVPERAFGHGPVTLAARQSAGEVPIVDADRPTRLHSVPQPAQVVLLSPEGPVMTMGWSNTRVRIVTSLGPERITPRWWLVGEAGRQPAPRDYYKVQDERGRWWWLYRQVGTSNWFVHGRWC